MTTGGWPLTSHCFWFPGSDEMKAQPTTWSFVFLHPFFQPQGKTITYFSPKHSEHEYHHESLKNNYILLYIHIVDSFWMQKHQKHIMLLSIHTCVLWDQENRRCNTSTKSRTHCSSEQESESENESRKRERESEREWGRWRGKEGSGKSDGERLTKWHT